MTRALVIGFGPFPGAPRNPSAELVRRLGQRRRPAFAGTRIVTAVLPVSYAAVDRELPELLSAHDPDVVLFFGLAGRTSYMRVEQRAVNRATAFYPDATRSKLPTRALAPALAAEQRVRADTRRLLSAARGTGIDARLSRDAGRYVCNAALYRALELSGRRAWPRLVAFIHIPAPRRRGRLDGKRGRPRPTMDALIRAGEAALVALLTERS